MRHTYYITLKMKMHRLKVKYQVTITFKNMLGWEAFLMLVLFLDELLSELFEKFIEDFSKFFCTFLF